MRGHRFVELLEVKDAQVPQSVVPKFLADPSEKLWPRSGGILPRRHMRAQGGRSVVQAPKQQIAHVQVFGLEVQSQALAFQQMDVRVAGVPAHLRHVDPSLQPKLCDLARLRDDLQTHRFVLEALLDPNLESGLWDVERGFPGRIKELHRTTQEAVVNARLENLRAQRRIKGVGTEGDEDELPGAVGAQGPNANARRHGFARFCVEHLERPMHRGFFGDFRGCDCLLVCLPRGQRQAAFGLVRAHRRPSERQKKEESQPFPTLHFAASVCVSCQ